MAKRFDYEVLSLDRVPTGEHKYHWKCKHKHTDRLPVAPQDLGALLDEFGANGWQVVAAAVDSRWGNQVVLMKELSDGEPTSEPKVLLQEVKPFQPDVVTKALLSEVKALREAVETQQIWHTPMCPAPALPFDPRAIEESTREMLVPFLHELQAISERFRQESAAGAATLHAQTLALAEVGAALTRFSAVIERQQFERQSFLMWSTMIWRKWSNALSASFARVGYFQGRPRAAPGAELVSG